MDNIVVERSAFVGLVTSAVEAYNRETNGFLVGNRGTRLVRQRPREVTVLRAAYPLRRRIASPIGCPTGMRRRSNEPAGPSRTPTSDMPSPGGCTGTRGTTGPPGS